MPVKIWQNIVVTALGGGLLGNSLARGDWLLMSVGVLILIGWFWWMTSLTGWLWRRDHTRKKGVTL